MIKRVIIAAAFFVLPTFSLLADDGTLPKLPPLENEMVRIEFSSNDERFTVLDRRTGRSWTPAEFPSEWTTLNRETIPGGVKMVLYSKTRQFKIEATIRLEPDRPELSIRLDGDGDLSGSIFYPAPFSTRTGDRIILPMNEGLGIPADEPDSYFDHYSGIFYGGHGLCMAFFGIAEDATGAGAGLMGIVETMDDAALHFRRDGDRRLAPQLRWDPQKKRFGDSRNLRLVLFDKGGHVAMTKRYRQYATEIGRLVTFRQKIERNPKRKESIDKLLGAADIWCWGTLRLETVRMLQESLVDRDMDRLEIVRNLKEAGIDRILWSAGGPAEALAALNALPNVLTSRYDIYQDIMDPAQRENLNVWNDCWIPEAWPDDLVWSDPGGTLLRGWAVRKKGETTPTVHCNQLCARKAADYARKRIGKDLETRPYTARFLDVTTASAWQECWHPEHPMTRSDCRVGRMKLLELVSSEFDLVCGGETGQDVAVPYCDYFEGMLSLGPFRVPDSGRNLPDIWDEVPDRVAKFQVGEQYRLPLWELVYHDCCVAMWYWGDYNNKIPGIWTKRDLFNALYGTPPMYLFERKQLVENRDRFAESAKVAMPVARLSAYEEMTDHRFLTPDRTIQQTVFANGVTVTVNFGTKTFTMSDGFSLEPLKSRILR